MISVVIPAYNEESVIETCLEAFLQQTIDQPFEIILVDNNSTDKTVEKAKKYADRLPLKIISEKKKGRGAARKAGFTAARGAIILSTDADTIVPPYWMEQLVSQFSDERIIAVTGTGRITDKGKFDNAFFNVLQPASMKAYRFTFGNYWLTGFNFAITKHAYMQSGGFNEELNAQEDVELAFRVKKLGKIKYVKNISVQVSGRRYQKGMVVGMFPYFSTFLGYFLFKRTDMILSDPR